MSALPTVRELAAVIRLEADEQYAGMKHSKRLTPKGADEKMRKLLVAAARNHATPLVPSLLEAHRWKFNDICAGSRVDFDSIGASRHPAYLLNLFEPEDVIWTGEVYEMGERNFRTREQCLEAKTVFPPLTCPSTFKPGIWSRKLENILHKRFLVVESDTMDRDTVGAVFRWLRDENNLNLRAIVDTGGKSLHAWFDYPVELWPDLKLVLPALECDKSLFIPCLPCRMPGVGRNGRFQRLIYQS